MSRLLVLIALLLPLAAPGAHAEPLARVAVGPNGPAHGEEPYYLEANLSAPERPHEAEREHDCAWRKPSPNGTPPEREPSWTSRLLSWDPVAEPRVSGWFPRCVAFAPGQALPVPAYASYNVTSGRYYVEAHAMPALASPILAASFTMTGTTGLGLGADCEGCPPPGLG